MNPERDGASEISRFRIRLTTEQVSMSLPAVWRGGLK